MRLSDRVRAFALVAGIVLSPLSTHAQSVNLHAQSDGLIAEYRLASPVSALRFKDTGVVRSDWTSQTLTARLHEDRVEAHAGLFAGFDLKLEPDSTEDGRGYIAVSRVGEGYVLFAPALTGADDLLQLSTKAPSDWTLWPANDVSGYVYLGPNSLITPLGKDAVAIVAPGTAPSVRMAALVAFDDAFGFFESRFDAPPKAPTLIVTPQGVGPMSFRADVTDTGVISIRLSGASWSDPASSSLNDLTLLVFHESVHLWNSHFAEPAEGSPWLHEGGAHYLAMVAAVSTGHMSEAAAREALGANLTGCRRALGRRLSPADRMADGGAVYDCGALIQWLSDMELRQASDGRQRVLDVWADLIRRARDGRPAYGPDDFMAALRPDNAVSDLLYGPAESRWDVLERRLTDLGVQWDNRPSRQDYLVAALFHLNNNNCAPGSEKGFYLRDGYVEMDNAETCGALSGRLELAAIEDVDPMAEPQAMFEAVQRRCGLGGTIHFTRRGDARRFQAACKTQLVTPTAYSITAAPSLRAS